VGWDFNSNLPVKKGASLMRQVYSDLLHPRTRLVEVNLAALLAFKTIPIDWGIDAEGGILTLNYW
jgi:hypothetical protein